MLCALGLEDVGSNACIGSSTTYVVLIVLWESIICPWDEFSKWHAWDCLLGECENCEISPFVQLRKKDHLAIL
jgi:hypothetical protein